MRIPIRCFAPLYNISKPASASEVRAASHESPVNKTMERIAFGLLRITGRQRRRDLRGRGAAELTAGAGTLASAKPLAASAEMVVEPETEQGTSSWGAALTDATFDLNETVPLQSYGGGRRAREEHSGDLVGTPNAAHGIPRYRVLGRLGQGGMGTVFRAEDTRLGRTVAFKLLPPALMANRRAKERFFLEARAASALDHPNICTIHEIEETPEGQLCLVMACYDGETLKSRLERGPLPVADAVHITQQVARGLAKAHREGIVHCDIKPANLMLTGDGIVKILDFGIARLSGRVMSLRDGSSFGTPAYRSAEQARGEEVGAASDVWSLGIVLYEMLTGQPPGRGRQGETLLGEEPNPIARRRPEAPPELDRILSRMLAREPADRYPDAADLLADLDRLERRIAASDAKRRASRLRWRLLAAALGAGVSLAAVLQGYFAQGRNSSVAARRPALTSHPVPATFRRLTDFPGIEWYPSLSPDGEVVLYVRPINGRSHIFRQQISDGNTVDLTTNSPADDTQPAFAPDGRRIAFRSERNGGGIFTMGETGGAARQLTQFGFNPSWSPDGKYIVYATESVVNPAVRRRESSIWRVEVATGSRRKIPSGDAVQPSWSPHGKRIAYWGLQSFTGQRVIWTVSAAGGKAVPVIKGSHLYWCPVWSPDGSFLYFGSDRSGIDNLWRVPIDEASGRVYGEAEPITKSTQAAILPSISRDGRRIAYSSAEARTTLERVGFNSANGQISSPAAAITQPSGELNSFDVSPDGGRLVYKLATPREAFFTIRPDGSGLRRLIDDEFRNRTPRWSPDGSRIAFYSNRSGKYEIWTIRADGSELEQATKTSGRPLGVPVWSPDAKRLAVAAGNEGALIDLTKPLAERFVQLLPSPGRGESFSVDSWSADGRWLAGALHQPDGTRSPGIVLYSLTDKRYVRSTAHGAFPYWMHDNRRLLYRERGGIFLLDTQSGRSRPVIAPVPGSTYVDLKLSPDEHVLYLAQAAAEGDIWLLIMP
jgi:Tol biopolymer transport system component/serine/threonine protein kinase